MNNQGKHTRTLPPRLVTTPTQQAEGVPASNTNINKTTPRNTNHSPKYSRQTPSTTATTTLNIPSITQLNPTPAYHDLNPYTPFSYRSIRAGVPHRLPIPNLFTPSLPRESEANISRLPKRYPIVFTNSGPAVPKPVKPPQNAISDLKLLAGTLRRANRPIGLVMCYFSLAIYYENAEAYSQALTCLLKGKKVIDGVGIGEASMVNPREQPDRGTTQMVHVEKYRESRKVEEGDVDGFIREDIPMHVPLVLYLKSCIALCSYMLGRVPEAELEYRSMRALIESGTLTEFCVRQGTCYILEYSREEQADETLMRMNSLILASIHNGEALCNAMQGRSEEALQSVHKAEQCALQAGDAESASALKMCFNLFQGKFDTHSSLGDYMEIANDGFKYSHGISTGENITSKMKAKAHNQDPVKTDEAISFLLLSGDILSRKKEFGLSEQILHKAYLKSMAAQNQEKMLDASCHLGISRGTAKVEEELAKLVSGVDGDGDGKEEDGRADGDEDEDGGVDTE